MKTEKILSKKVLISILFLVSLANFASDGNRIPNVSDNLKQSSFSSDVEIISGRESALKKTQTVFTYNENSVYEITVSPNFVTALQLSPDEEVNDYVIGNIDEWPVADSKGGKRGGTYVFLSAEEEGLQTNLIIITNKRVYNLKLKSTLNEYNSLVKWTYPDTKEMILFNEQSNRTMVTSPDKINMEYYIGNKKENFAPINVYDDGEFTYFKMKKSFKDMPVVFMQEVDGNFTEVPVDVNDVTNGNNILKVRKVSKKIRFTVGKKTINIINQNYGG